MNEMTLFNTNTTEKYIQLSIFIEHVLLRSQQIQAGLTNFTEDTVKQWLEGLSITTAYSQIEPMIIDTNISEQGCVVVANTLPNENLRRLVLSDTLVLFGGRAHVYEMINSTYTPPKGLERGVVSDGFNFEPEGTTPFYFPNGARGISSLYLPRISEELGRQGLLGNSPIRPHREVLAKIRTWQEKETHCGIFHHEMPNSYFDIKKDKYISSRGREEPHIWMSPDFCLALAATEHMAIQIRVIDDLNRLTNIVNALQPTQIPSPTLPQYLPGTIEHQYKEEGLLEVMNARSMGYITMAEVKHLWSHQNGQPQEAFDDKYPWETTYKELFFLMDYMSHSKQWTASHTGEGRTHLFHIDVLKNYFKDIDFNTVIQ